MRFITGDECGLIKECIPEKVVNKNQPSTANVKVVSPETTVTKDEEGIRLINAQAKQSRRRGVVAMAWTQPDDDEQFAALRIDGTVELWQRSHSEEQSFGGYLQATEMKRVFDDPKRATTSVGGGGADAPIHPSTHPLGLESFIAGNDQVQLCACNAAGTVVILNPTRQESVVQRFSVYKQSEQTKGTLKQDEQEVALATTFALDVALNRVAVGGRDRETVLFDIETGKQVWKTKNLAPDPQTLLQPQVWPTAIRFLSSDCVLGSNIMAVGNAHRQVRIYDVRTSATQRRPICWTPEGLLEHRVTAITQTDANHIVVGDAAGYLHTLDLRKLGRPIKKDASVNTVGRYVGPAGSVRGLVTHASAPRLAVAGLDRMLRIYDTTKRKQVSCMYMKQRLNCVLVGRDEMWGNNDNEENDNDDNYEEDLLDNEGVDQDDVVRDFVDSDEEEGDRNDVSGDSNSDQDDDDGPPDDTEAAEIESEEEEEEEESDDDDDAGDNDDDESEEKIPFARPPPKRRRR